MARPKSKVKRVNVKITLDPDVYNKARESIDNLSRYVEACLIKHIDYIKKHPQSCDNIYYAKNNTSFPTLSEMISQIEESQKGKDYAVNPYDLYLMSRSEIESLWLNEMLLQLV